MATIGPSMNKISLLGFARNKRKERQKTGRTTIILRSTQKNGPRPESSKKVAPKSALCLDEAYCGCGGQGSHRNADKQACTLKITRHSRNRSDRHDTQASLDSYINHKYTLADGLVVGLTESNLPLFQQRLDRA